MNDVFLNGPARSAYDAVLVPLSEGLDEIIEIKRADVYHRPPYVKLQTKNEGDCESAKVYPYIIRQDSYLSSVYKVYAGARNLASNSMNSSGASGWLNDWSFGYIDPWNCNREKTAEVLRTSLVALRPSLHQIDAQLSQDGAFELLDVLDEKLSRLQQTVERAKKTIYYVYRTYDHGVDGPEEKEELADSGNGPECIYEQYRALCSLLDDLSSLRERVAEKQALSKSQMISLASGSSLRESSLQFASPEAASLWFCKQRLNHRKRVCGGDEASLERLGRESYADLIRTHRLAQKTPESFIGFAKTIDREIAKVCRRDKIKSAQFVGEVYTRWLEKLKEEGVQVPLSIRPDHFKMWFKELCANEVSRIVYQAIFSALINSEGTGPYRLDCAPSALNAIMQSNYFPMFEDSSMVLNFSR